MKRKKILFLCFFGLGAAVFFLSMKGKDDHSYFIKTENGNIVIYNKDNTVYEYTDLEPEFLPEEVTKELIQGIYFQDQEDLYEFLETYSS